MLTPEQKAEIARKNGAKSKGPVTAEGKARSSRNAIKHGRRASALALIVPPHTAVHANEDRQEFYRLFDENVAKYRPSDPPELAIVRAITDCGWHLRRCAVIESAIYNRELIRQSAHIPQDHLELAALETSIAVAEALAGNKVLADLRKQTMRLLQQVRHLERRLHLLRKHFPSTTAELPTTAADKEENLFEIAEETATNEPTGEPTEPFENKKSEPQIIKISEPLTPAIRDMYRECFPGRDLEFHIYPEPGDLAA